MTTITQSQFDSLRNEIYESLISNPDYGLGEMGSCRDEAERIIEDWMEKESITLID